MSKSKEKLIISACLAGQNCRYDGQSQTIEGLSDLIDRYELIPVCPEQAGGMSTPRIPCELQTKATEILAGNGKIKNQNGDDQTVRFVRGAWETFSLAARMGAKKALLKNGSPSCGSSRIYDGTFKNRQVSGEGMTAALLRENGFEIWSEENAGEL